MASDHGAKILHGFHLFHTHTLSLFPSLSFSRENKRFLYLSHDNKKRVYTVESAFKKVVYVFIVLCLFDIGSSSNLRVWLRFGQDRLDGQTPRADTANKCDCKSDPADNFPAMHERG